MRVQQHVSRPFTNMISRAGIDSHLHIGQHGGGAPRLYGPAAAAEAEGFEGGSSRSVNSLAVHPALPNDRCLFRQLQVCHHDEPC